MPGRRLHRFSHHLQRDAQGATQTLEIHRAARGDQVITIRVLLRTKERPSRRRRLKVTSIGISRHRYRAGSKRFCEARVDARDVNDHPGPADDDSIGARGWAKSTQRSRTDPRQRRPLPEASQSSFIGGWSKTTSESPFPLAHSTSGRTLRTEYRSVRKIVDAMNNAIETSTRIRGPRKNR